MKFDLAEIPLLLSAANGVFLTLIIRSRKYAIWPAKFFLIILALLNSWHLFAIFLVVSGHVANLPHALWRGYPISFLLGPLFFLYTRSVFTGKKRFFWYDALHFLPFAWELYAARGFYLFEGRAEMERFFGLGGSHPEVSPEMLLSALRIAVVSIIYSTLSYLAIRRSLFDTSHQTRTVGCITIDQPNRIYLTHIEQVPAGESTTREIEPTQATTR